MKKFFNTAGPCNEKNHFMVPFTDISKEIMVLIEREQYFVIHAARQTGKTTLLLNLTKEINKAGIYYALYCTLEEVQFFKEPEKGIPQIFSVIEQSLLNSSIPNVEKFGKNIGNNLESTIIRSAISNFCKTLDKPLVIFFDEIDGIENGTLITFLRQLRSGYITRTEVNFAHSIALVGLRDVRDYKAKVREGQDTLGSKSPFNIIAESFTLKNFSLLQIEDLYNQHTKISGQIFEKEAIEYIYEQSCGQPWLVNAIAKEIIEKLLKNDFSKPVTSYLAKQAIQNIILRRDTHIDSLLAKLHEERVRKIIQAVIITTVDNLIDYTNDDLQYCIDLGIIKLENKILKPANPIYSEIIIRELSYNTQSNLNSSIQNNRILQSGKIDMESLLKSFQIFWRENSDIWIEKYQYKEAAPHLILQAFLQRVINGGGEILREYSYGAKRIDLCVLYNKSKYPIELKLNYGAKTIPDGLRQLSEYMDGFGEKTGWLVIFDRESSKTWDEKLFWKSENYEGKNINIVGC